MEGGIQLGQKLWNGVKILFERKYCVVAKIVCDGENWGWGEHFWLRGKIIVGTKIHIVSDTI